MTDETEVVSDRLADSDRLYEQAPCGLLSTTPDGHIRRVNRTLAKWLGVSATSLVGESFVSLLDTGARIFYETRYLPALRLNGEVHEVALTLRGADGGPLSVLLSSTLVRDDDDETIAIDSAVFDSTRRQDYERQLLAARRDAESSEARIRSLQAASAAFVLCESVESLAQAVAESFKGAFTASEVAVHLAGEGVLRLAAGSQPFEVRDVAIGMHIRDSVIRVSTSEPAGAAAVATALDSAQLEELTLTPLLEGDRMVGTVTCFFGRAREADPTADELHYALARQAVQVLRRIRLQKQLEAIALYDPLTGLANRVLLRTRLTSALADAAREGRPLAVLFVDLDRFKEVNDLFDHSAGDDVLRLVARRLVESVRQEDLVGRFGGDEFLIVCENIDEVAAAHVAERIRKNVKLPLTGIADERVITASIGVAVHTPTGGDALTPAEVFRIADAAMYQAKNAGKDQVTIAAI